MKHIITIMALVAVLSGAACADTTVSEASVVRGSQFIYGLKGQPVKASAFIYDVNAPAIRGDRFMPM